MGYQELGQAAKPAVSSMRSSQAALGPNLSSSYSVVLGKSLGLSLPIHKMERTCPTKLGLLLGLNDTDAVFGMVLAHNRIYRL